MKITLIILGVVALLVLLACAGLLPGAVEFPFTLAFGWASYLTNVLPAVHVDRAALGWSIIGLAALLLVGHAFAQWLWRETAPSPSSTRAAWRLRWTLAGTVLVLLTFSAGIAASGVAHQSAWLARSETPMFVNRYARQDQHDISVCSEYLEQIGYALRDYTGAHAGQYPDTLDQLVSQKLQAYALRCPATNLDRYSPRAQEDHLADRPTYTYYARNLRVPLPPRTPIASEPIANHKLAGVNILFADGKVEWHTPSELQSLLNPPPPGTRP